MAVITWARIEKFSLLYSCAHEGFAKDVVNLLSTNFQVGSY